MGHRDDRDGDPRQPADLRREHAAGVDHDVGGDLGALAAVLDRDARSPGRRSTPIADDPRARPDRRRLAPARPAASAWARPDGSSQPSVGRQTAPSTPSVDHQREAAPAPRRRRSAPAAARRSWPSPPGGAAPRSRSGVDGQPERADLVPADGSTPVSAASRRYGRDAVHHHPGQGHGSSAAGRPGRPSGRSSRDVSSARSTRTTSVQPSSARW